MFWNSRFSWWLLIFVLAGDFIVPVLLAFGFKGYSCTRRVISVLSSTGSPVKRLCRFWMLLQGVLFAISGVNLFLYYQTVSYTAALWLMITLIVFAALEGIVASFYSIEEDVTKLTTSAVIHNTASVTAFAALSFEPLFMAVLMFRQRDLLLGGLSTVCFAAALGFQALFLFSVGPARHRVILGLSGLWQRAALFCMYLPLAAAAAKNIIN
ncbi:DUF998 domain-containing protein [Acetanaerobacterium elongatum]|uniref:DUF998 domain-containing protein n=1 Tax=Acetanaerobacterium elongatum TaxID=258515 RepID=A0A1H0G423_9FIRM|nr:DUF998 domain-containing protein [Acetanaerobacterium elongatum]SDO01663.1 Protein of unknown function [Acetanaerobacterium elongatum]